MTSLVKPGLLFQAEPLFKRPLDAGAPCPNTTYVVCQDGTIQNYHEPTRPVNWRLTEDAMGWYYDGNKPLAVYFRGRTDEPPIGTSYMDRQDSPQFAEVTEQSDDGSEVSSIDPLLAQCAVIVNDPVQTAALAKFAEGKMSYAEMRGLCG
jgi:hypothetical protein